MAPRNQKLELTWFNKHLHLIPKETGRYGYSWVSARDPRYCETHTLINGEVISDAQADKEEGRTYSERADLEPTNGNLLINGESGDVLEALTRVPELAKEYVGKVKCVYIDPPFNTSQTFTSYDDALEHSVWLTMMRDRLEHLHKLLADDGSIWVHLDDVENHRMRLLLDEVFGAGSFQAEVVWQKADSPRSDVSGFSADHDVILVYGKSPAVSLNRMERTAADNARFSNPDGDTRGPWFSDNRSAAGNVSGKKQHPSVFAIQHPITGEIMYPSRGGHWRYSQDRILDSLKEFADFKLVAPDIKERAKQAEISVDKIRPDIPDVLIAQKDISENTARQRIAQGNWPEFYFTESTIGRKHTLLKMGSRHGLGGRMIKLVTIARQSPSLKPYSHTKLRSQPRSRSAC